MRPLITDRSRAHVVMLENLRRKSWDNMTASEQEAWYGEAAKGAYNYTDLNRVEEVVRWMAGLFGLKLNTKTDWSTEDVPTQAEMERYLGNVAAVKSICSEKAQFPPLPGTMNRLGYEDANNIEKTLLVAYQDLDSCMRLGDVYCGEV